MNKNLTPPAGFNSDNMLGWKYAIAGKARPTSTEEIEPAPTSLIEFHHGFDEGKRQIDETPDLFDKDADDDTDEAPPEQPAAPDEDAEIRSLRLYYQEQSDAAAEVIRLKAQWEQLKKEAGRIKKQFEEIQERILETAGIPPQQTLIATEHQYDEGASEAYKQGHKAGVNGEPASACPYVDSAITPELKGEWLQGWHDGCRQERIASRIVKPESVPYLADTPDGVDMLDVLEPTLLGHFDRFQDALRKHREGDESLPMRADNCVMEMATGHAVVIDRVGRFFVLRQLFTGGQVAYEAQADSLLSEEQDTGIERGDILGEFAGMWVELDGINGPLIIDAAANELYIEIPDADD